MTVFKIPGVMTADELTELAFHRAAKKSKPGGAGSKLTRERAFAIAKLQIIQDVLTEKLKKYTKGFPSIDNLHPFYNQLVDVLVGNDRLKKALGAMDWGRRKIAGVCTANIRRIKTEDNINEIQKHRNAAYGRVASVLKQINSELLLLNTARETLRKMPDIDPEVPTVVIAGYPNVGKSMLVERLSSARPEIAAYPFTTKQVLVGHIEVEWVKYQVIDTPGLLDSDPSEKKNIERQAVMALEHLANLMVFVLDPSEYCGYPLEVQLGLSERLKNYFPKLAMIEVENKSDLKVLDSERLKISAMKGEGIDKLKELILSELKTIESNPEPETQNLEP
ncbi:MAG: 50S ribosome-binding GTPase [Thermoplasmata archaeon]|nr:MAG: 50S ribosome-binding GTPase [Thermoplasmata archaeon]